MLTRGAASYPPGLAALCRVPAVLRGLRLARSPLRYRLAPPPLAPNPGYCRPARSAAPLSPPSSLHRVVSPPVSLLLPDGFALSEPRSVRADVIPGSERSAATATRQRGGGARRVDRGGGARRPPFGRAAERARSAARASSGHPPPHSALYPRAPPAWGWS